MTTTVTLSRTTKVFNALTTVFTAPSSCATFTYTFNTALDGTTYALRESGIPGQGTFSPCWPPNFAELHMTTGQGYSPGVCPSGYTGISLTAFTSVSVSACCPSYFDRYTTAGTGLCMQTISTPTIISHPGSGLVVASSFIAQQWPIYVRWASSNLNEFNPPSAPLLTPGATVTNAFSSSNPTTTAGFTSTTPSATSTPGGAGSSTTTSSQSSGARIGIGVGIGVGVTGIITVLIAFFILRRKRRQRQARETLAPREEMSQEQSVLSQSRFEEAGAVYQLHSEPKPAEADSGLRPELPADEERPVV